MSEFLAGNILLIKFIHLLFAVTWVGGMIAMRFATHFGLATIEEPTVKMTATLEALARFFKMVIAAVILMGATGIIMMIGFDYKSTNPTLYGLAHAKTSIWLVMALIFAFIYFRFLGAKKAFAAGDLEACAAKMKPISTLIPVNIALGILAIFIGVILRGF